MSNLLAQLQQYFDVYHFLLRGEHYAGLGVHALKLVGHWLHIPILCLVALLVVFAVVYQLWCWRERARLLEGTHYVSTAHGFIDYQWYGSGPVVLVLHGTPGGSDQGGIWHQLLLGGENFAVLAPSRFGYVGTRSQATSSGGKTEPSSSGLTLAQQAEAISDLLHALDLTQVAVVGIGGGGPLAMELVKNYSHKCWALVLIGAVTRKWQPPEVVSFNNEVDMLERFIFEQINGMCMWGYYLLSTLSPSTVLRSLYAAGSSLDPQATEKHMRAAMEKMTHRLALRRAARSCLPPSLRLDGINRDYALFASLPEQIDMGRADSVPALIVHGKADQSVPASQHAEPVHTAIAGSELYLIDEGSDMLWLGLEGEAVSRKVLSFLMTHMERGKVDELPHFYPPSNVRAALTTTGGGASVRRKTRAPNDTSKPKNKRKKDKEG